jgi:glycosyltransferase involved in cell wall biosynthesis
VTVLPVPAGPAKQLPKDELLPYMGAFGRWLADAWAGDWTPDVVHGHFWMSGLAALTARSAHPTVPVVETYHALGTVKRRYQGDADTSPAQRIGYERVLGRQVDRVIAQCSDEVAELVSMGVPRSSISVVPSGVDSELFQPYGPVALPPREGGRILAPGRLVERKGYADIIEALPLVPDAELVVVGGPPASRLSRDPLAKKLRALAKEHGVADRFTMVGAVRQEEMPAWYRSADVVACASWYEPFGFTPLEAMACGVPVVAYAVGGFMDTVVDKVTGLLVPARDRHALGLALRTLLTDPLRRLEYGAAGTDRARSRFAWDRAADQLSTVYQELTGVPADTARVLSQ